MAYYGIKREDLQTISDMRLAEAMILKENNHPSGAYYLAGYAVELALKACISKQIHKNIIPDKSFITAIYTHSLQDLVKLAGLERDRLLHEKQNSNFLTAWLITKDWSEQSRYEIKHLSDATYLLEAVSNQQHGVMKWIKTHW